MTRVTRFSDVAWLQSTAQHSYHIATQTPPSSVYNKLPAPAAAYCTACCVKCFLWLSHMLKASISPRSLSITCFMAAFLEASCVCRCAMRACSSATAAGSSSCWPAWLAAVMGGV